MNTSSVCRRARLSDVVFGLLGLLLCGSLCPSPLAPREALAQELLQNGGFEEGDAPWSDCGGAERVDAQDAGTTAAMVRSAYKPRCVRMGRTMRGSSIVAITRVRPLHCGQTRTSTANTYWSKSAHRQRGGRTAADGGSLVGGATAAAWGTSGALGVIAGSGSRPAPPRQGLRLSWALLCGPTRDGRMAVRAIRQYGPTEQIGLAAQG